MNIIGINLSSRFRPIVNAAAGMKTPWDVSMVEKVVDDVQEVVDTVGAGVAVNGLYMNFSSIVTLNTYMAIESDLYCYFSALRAGM